MGVKKNPPETYQQVPRGCLQGEKKTTRQELLSPSPSLVRIVLQGGSRAAVRPEQVLLSRRGPWLQAEPGTWQEELLHSGSQYEKRKTAFLHLASMSLRAVLAGEHTHKIHPELRGHVGCCIHLVPCLETDDASKEPAFFKSQGCCCYPPTLSTQSWASMSGKRFAYNSQAAACSHSFSWSWCIPHVPTTHCP